MRISDWSSDVCSSDLLEAVFTALGVQYARGAETENKNKPDFLFPGPQAYHDDLFPRERLTMLGAKSTPKDRWGQVLSEAEKINEKHLLTLSPGISENQTDEMRAKRLQLVVQSGLYSTSRTAQKNGVLSRGQLLTLVDAQ